MCGRFGLTKPEKIDPKTIGADEWERITSLVPRFNIAPSQDVAVVLDIVSNEGGRRVLAGRAGASSRAGPSTPRSGAG